MNNAGLEQVLQEQIKSAEATLRDTVAKRGNTHPETLQMLLQYVCIVRHAGQSELAERLQAKAKALMEILSKDPSQQAEATKAVQAAKAAEAARQAALAKSAEDAKAQAAAKAAEAARLAEEAKAAEAKRAALEAEQNAELDKKASLAKKAEKAKAAAEEGVFDLDMFEDDDEETMALTLELVKETPALAPAAVKAATAVAEATASREEAAAIFLYNSKGEHVAVAYKAGLYSPQGENIGRLLEDFDVYLDRSGWYLGQIVDGNRLARDLTWKHRDLNFGDRGNEGNCSGWGRSPDIERTFFDRGFEDVNLGD
ncbi:MAG: hypothetical protein K2X27_17450 [Candidatus Obscuribacterales bacterium]|nr:hypothetical protein [Candidatus Obscuribacterales bacterium]